MSRTDIDNITSNKRNNFFSMSSEPPWTSSSFTAIDKSPVSNDSTLDSDIQTFSSGNYNNTEDDNIDWDLVSKQLELQLRTSPDSIQSLSNEGYQRKLPSQIPKQDRFHSIINHGFTVIQPTPQDDENTISQTTSPINKGNITSNQEKLILNQLETNTSNNPTSILNELFNKLNACQKKQAVLLNQIHQFLNQSKQISSSTFFLPFNNHYHNNQIIPSLQDAFQQRKSSFIQQSKTRVNQIYRQKNRSHRQIIPNIKQSKNTYLQERRQYENDRLCAMIIKHQNRENAKIYGNLIKNQLCHH